MAGEHSDEALLPLTSIIAAPSYPYCCCCCCCCCCWGWGWGWGCWGGGCCRCGGTALALLPPPPFRPPLAPGAVPRVPAVVAGCAAGVLTASLVLGLRETKCVRCVRCVYTRSASQLRLPACSLHPSNNQPS